VGKGVVLIFPHLNFLYTLFENVIHMLRCVKHVKPFTLSSIQTYYSKPAPLLMLYMLQERKISVYIE